MQVLRLLESFELADLHAAVKQALQLGAAGFDAVMHLILCRVERRPPRLDPSIYPYLPRATVETTSESRSILVRKGPPTLRLLTPPPMFQTPQGIVTLTEQR